MYKGKMICVVVPAYNEEKLIGRVIETMPDFVDNMIIVDDQSEDNTAAVVMSYAKKMRDRVTLIRRKKNQGVGASVTRGYKRARYNGADITVVMTGDAQMKPDDLPGLLEPIIRNEADYAKGNRLVIPGAWHIIPKHRYVGNLVLSFCTKIASGYWQVLDSQCSYTAINSEALHAIKLNRIYKRYGMPNDMLVHLNIGNFRVKDVPVMPVYHIGGKSGIRLWKVIPTLSWLLTNRFIFRLKAKNMTGGFHHVVSFYSLSVILLLTSIIMGMRTGYRWVSSGYLPRGETMLCLLVFLIGVQCMLLAGWFDMEYNKKVKKDV
jgi:glycosyltransferase involved in cell wall biosynthesis